MFLSNTFKNNKIKKLNKKLLKRVQLESFNKIIICESKILFSSQNFNKHRTKDLLVNFKFNSNKDKHCSQLTNPKKEHEKSFWKEWLSHVQRLTYDQVSLTRVVNSFHFDFPKTIPNFKDYLQSIFTKAQYETELNSRFNQNTKKLVENEVTIKEKSNVTNLLNKSSQLQVNKSNLELPNSHLKKETEIDSSLKKGEGVLLSASEAMVATLKNFSYYLPKSKKSASSHIKDSNHRAVSTVVDKHTGQTKVKITWMESEKEAIERGIRSLLQQYDDDDAVMLELCKYLANFPSSATIAVQNTNLVDKLLEARNKGGYEVLQATNKALRLLGHADALKSKGICLLSLDGGGTRGLITLNILKELERLTGRPIYELFNYVCGVSTGSLIGVMACLLKLPLHQAEYVYRHFSKKMFERNRIIGASKLVMSHAYYDTSLYEDILRNIGVGTFVDSMSDCCHLSVVSTLMNAARVQNYLFRNYNLPPSTHSRYKGSAEHRLWQAVRASSAAPGYFEEYELDGHVHQDGGVLTNNPTAIAIHEAKKIWPNESIQCIVSIGTGWHEASNDGQQDISKSSLRSKITKVIESATDTEGIHMVLNDFLPSPQYFRFNPRLSGVFELDETRDSFWKQMQQDTNAYCKKQRSQLEAAASQLVRKKSRLEVANRWIKHNVKSPFTKL